MKIKLLLYLSITFTSFIFAQNLDELKKLQSEYKSVLERQSLQKSKEISDAEKTASSTALPDKLIYSRKDIESLLVNTQRLLDELNFLEDSLYVLPYIGYDIFTKRDSTPFWQNLPLPREYYLGPGDEIIIALWGETESYNSKTINRDGQIFIDNIGILNLSGKSIIEAKKYIKSKYSKLYSTLLGIEPKSYIDISLGELKSVNVHFVGFVNIPGVHMIHPFSNVITGLSQSGGVDINGSLRNIKIIRNGKTLNSIDLYNYLYNGKSPTDIRLLDQDIIFVPSRLSTVSITGGVRKPGYYEIIDSESLNYLLDIAGGLDSKSSNTIFAYQNGNDSQDALLINLKETYKHKISDGDSIHIPFKPIIEKFININGQIKNPGKYPFQKGMNLQKVFSATMTSEDNDFMKTINVQRITISRKNPSGIKPINFYVDLEKDNFELMNGDVINVPRIQIFSQIETIHITGEIKIPGIYPVNNLTTLSEIIHLAGGFTKSALNSGVQVFRDSIKIGWNDDSFYLSDGDSLNVIKKTGLILISGEVNVPGYLSFKKGDSIKKYIKRAGGYSSFADKKDVFIIYPNGTAKPKSKFNSPKVFEGSEIIINQRKISNLSKNDNKLQNFSAIASSIGNITTTLVTLSLLINQTKTN